jgi:hypothetical protein
MPAPIDPSRPTRTGTGPFPHLSGARAVFWSTAMCVWGAFLLIVGVLAHHVNVFGVLAGAIFLAAGLRWLWLALARRSAARDADATETR